MTTPDIAELQKTYQDLERDLVRAEQDVTHATQERIVILEKLSNLGYDLDTDLGAQLKKKGGEIDAKLAHAAHTLEGAVDARPTPDASSAVSGADNESRWSERSAD